MSPSNEQRRIPPCEDCGGVQVGRFRLVGKGPVGLHRHIMPFLNPMATLVGFICLGCGRVRLGVDDLEKLRQQVHSKPQDFVW